MRADIAGRLSARSIEVRGMACNGMMQSRWERGKRLVRSERPAWFASDAWCKAPAQPALSLRLRDPVSVQS